MCFRKASSILLLMLCTGYFVNAQPLSVTVSTSSTCNHNGTAWATVTGGTPPYSYLWSRYSANWYTPSITGLTGGFYSLKVTDAVGAIGYGYGQIQFPIQFYPDIIPDTCNYGVGAVNLIQLSGTAPLSFLWSRGDTTQDIANVVSGLYDLAITDGNGCMVLASELIDSVGAGGIQAIVVYDVAPFSVAISTTPGSCTNGTAMATPAGGTAPYTYLWNTIPVQTSQTATGLTGNHTYNVIITDNAGCTGTFYAYPGAISNLSGGVNTSPDTCSRGIATATAYGIAGSPPYSYNWSFNQTGAIVDSLGSGYYQVLITDNLGCEHSVQTFIQEYSPVQFTYNTIQASCTTPTGSIIVSPAGGFSPYNYFWQTNPVQTTATADSLTAGNYGVIITDQNGCSVTATTTLLDNSNLQIAVASTPDVCNAHTGTALVTVAGGQAPYSYLWSNSVTNPSLNNLSYNWYTVTVTDAVGCVRSKKVLVGADNLISMSFNKTNASCIYSNDGSATVNVTGGSGTYTYQWSNGNTTQTATGLNPGYYRVNIADGNGCIEYGYIALGYDSILPCATIFEGTVYNDENVDCIQNGSDRGIANAYIKCDGYKFTDYNGRYQFTVPTGTYTTEQVYPPFWFSLSCPLVANTDTVSTGQTITHDFADVGNATDITLGSYWAIPPRPGFDFNQHLQVTNEGTTNIATPVLKVKHDSLVTFINSNPPASNYSLVDRTITFNLNQLFYNSSTQAINITYNLPSNVAIGTQLSFVDSVFPFAGDTVIYNNYANQYINVVGSYDPNEMEVTPHGSTAAGYISAVDSELTYTIRFQNTGNYPAQNVMIKTQIDDDLDLRTFEKGACSFPYSIEISESGMATFNMPNIFLPDSISNEPASHGFVAFKIKQQQNLSPGTLITANAGIYFDYNAPVITNDVMNTLTGLAAINIPNNSLVIAPNPSSGAVNAYYELKQAADVQIILYSMLGAKVKEWNTTKQESGVHQLPIAVDANDLAKGIYLLSVKINDAVVTKKMVRM